ncbi:hypothetical protein FN846DRAFT_885555 [Sphaerosporella brunnea]|uniref:Uncharacterized protein n=1 Tax=Sphaerosporella brunnea TaxID=1250544 RepID=A0A5J5FCS6_9PEZI|nr:hypothetical protein FN846DRAFT_885555 [Sphaerosporella brunnea]
MSESFEDTLSESDAEPHAPRHAHRSHLNLGALLRASSIVRPEAFEQALGALDLSDAGSDDEEYIPNPFLMELKRGSTSTQTIQGPEGHAGFEVQGMADTPWETPSKPIPIPNIGRSSEPTEEDKAEDYALRETQEPEVPHVESDPGPGLGSTPMPFTAEGCAFDSGKSGDGCSLSEHDSSSWPTAANEGPDFESEIGQRTCASSRPSKIQKTSDTAARKTTTLSGESPPEGDEDESPSSDDDENQGGDRRGRKTPQKNGKPLQDPARLFACPYHKRDPKNCEALCKTWGSSELHRVMQCPQCGYRAGEKAQIESHQKTKHKRPASQFEPVPLRVSALGKAIGRQRSWGHVYALLFNCADSEVPSPYLDSTEACPTRPGSGSSGQNTNAGTPTAGADLNVSAFVEEVLLPKLTPELSCLLARCLIDVGFNPNHFSLGQQVSTNTSSSSLELMAEGPRAAVGDTDTVANDTAMKSADLSAATGSTAPSSLQPQAEGPPAAGDNSVADDTAMQGADLWQYSADWIDDFDGIDDPSLVGGMDERMLRAWVAQ